MKLRNSHSEVDLDGRFTLIVAFLCVRVCAFVCVLFLFLCDGL